MDQNTEDWENQELVIICFLSVFGDMEQKYPWLTFDETRVDPPRRH